MKKLLIILIAIMVIGCTVEPEIETVYVPGESGPAAIPSELLGIWEKAGDAYNNGWGFYDDGDFIYYRTNPYEVINHGWYEDDSKYRTVYIEDYSNGSSATYDYEILIDYPGVGDITLRLNYQDYLKQ